MSKKLNFLILCGGILLIIFSLAHFFMGFPMINELIEQDGSSEDLAQTFRTIWLFSSITMFLSGCWAWIIYRQRKRDLRGPRLAGLLLGGGFVIFGSYGLFHPFPNYHLFMFALPGALIFLPSVLISEK